MRMVTRLVPVQMLLPKKYHIELSLNGEKSTLCIEETHEDDVSQDIIKNSLDMIDALLTARGVKGRVGHEGNKLALDISGSEEQVIDSLLSELELLLLYRETLSKPNMTRLPLPYQFTDKMVRRTE